MAKKKAAKKKPAKTKIETVEEVPVNITEDVAPMLREPETEKEPEMAKKKTAAKKATTNKKPRSESNSQKVRDYLDSKGDTKPSLIVKALADDGIVISAPQVSSVRAKWLESNGKADAPKKPAKAAPVASTNGSVSDAAKAFIRAAGSLDNALALLETAKAISVPF